MPSRVECVSSALTSLRKVRRGPVFLCAENKVSEKDGNSRCRERYDARSQRQETERIVGARGEQA
jgi:hypothetical protein